ncbi:hypothetical protein GCM10009837_24900 [Streptomyces durmitorensis]|uniref:Lipoprotein n=1 Tax=Streptomyces durmitorensis TaxID=319947 RepID=A0ABY4PPF7_9ACTN|nr:hypothetical protein [Streptomyces durmitorensis]UQT54903.1 hypothetical protein M4V62_07220 [Streptomyces durmitorensis]
MTGFTHRFRRWYGEGPLQLLVLLGSFALAGYAGVRLLDGDWLLIAVWFVGAALVHDLLFVPAYALADRALRAAAGGRRNRREWINFVRVPAFLSGLLLLVWFPLIAGQVERYESSTGLPAGDFLVRWLIVTALLFAGSALCRVLQTRRRARNERPPVVH